jgi:phosphate starvation-inducible PhoH-like protein
MAAKSTKARGEGARDTGPVQAKTQAQKEYIGSIKTHTLTFGVGVAGTGKSYIAVALAVEMLQAGEVEKIILTRPAVEAGAKLGHLPGELDEKFAPYLDPFRDALFKRLGRSHAENLIRNGTIQAKPLNYMRGSNLDNCFVILDEAQNTTPVEMKMFLTRIGKNTTVVVDGDPEQKDIPGPSGLNEALSVLKNLPDSNRVDFGVDDVVRSDIVGNIIRAYSAFGKKTARLAAKKAGNPPESD